MKRDVDALLDGWKAEGCPRMLAIEGVRGCGKTFSAKAFAERSFRDWAYFDVPADGLAGLIPEKDPSAAVAVLSEVRGSPLTGSTAVILDNMQALPDPRSVAEALVSSTSIGPLVCISSVTGIFDGAVRMRPMCFTEFLNAMGEPTLASALRDRPLSEDVSSNHGKLCRLSREFWAVGGMPEAVSAWADSRDARAVDSAIRSVLDDLRRDISTYHPGLAETAWSVMQSIPEQLLGKNRKFMFGRAVKGARSKTLCESLRLLDRMGATPVLQISSEIRDPLDSESVPPNFKLYMFDTGALRVLAGIPMGLMATEPRVSQDFVDGFYENLVLLELLSSGTDEVFCWRSGNKAEVGFVFRMHGETVPMQLNMGRMRFTRSITEYIRRFSPSHPVYMSDQPLSLDGPLLRVPVYMASSMEGTLFPSNREDVTSQR